MPTHLIALGGGGFAMEPDNPALDRYLLTVAQSRRAYPRVCFVPSATDNLDAALLPFYRAFAQFDCVPTHLSLFNLPTADLRGFILAQDLIYVGGGNTRSLLALWREWGLDAVFREAWAAGVVLAGMSAGANCWFAQCTTDSVPGELRVLPGLGLLPGSFTPHYANEPQRRPSLRRFLAEGLLQPGYAADDGAALHFVDGRLARAIRSRPAAQAYRVSLSGGAVLEEPLAMTAA
ncbi:MAG: peptidase E [Anaerolineales bacterium]|nr:peptidase E [Anaerolineales bacterium]